MCSSECGIQEKVLCPKFEPEIISLFFEMTTLGASYTKVFQEKIDVIFTKLIFIY